MKFERWGETIIGAIVVAIAVSFFAFAAAQAGQTAGMGASYDLKASFQRVDGVSAGSEVRISGVKVGVVKSIVLDPSTYRARITLTVEHGVQVPDSSTARIMTDGLLGGAYISIEPAGLDPLAPGADIPNTQGSVDLLTMLSTSLQGLGQSSNSTSTSTQAKP
jgi:phospholipid/cholesterol/gamma-HCH transport system substrate-binding protein